MTMFRKSKLCTLIFRKMLLLKPLVLPCPPKPCAKAGRSDVVGVSNSPPASAKTFWRMGLSSPRLYHTQANDASTGGTADVRLKIKKQLNSPSFLPAFAKASAGRRNDPSRHHPSPRLRVTLPTFAQAPFAKAMGPKGYGGHGKKKPATHYLPRWHVLKIIAEKKL